ncbi:MAG: GTPase Era [Coriobacteriia bacterium]|nr:GTPase Era [Coriobacteriia bacterium]
MFKSGFIALVGRPNAGKSTLINKLIGKHVAAATDVPQTTRHRIRAILNKPNMQAIFVDTPGLHRPYDVLGQELNESAFQAIADCDVVCMLIDATADVGAGDKWVASHIPNTHKICIISKADLVDDNQLNKQIENASVLSDWDAFVVLSSITGKNIDALIEEIENLLPEGPKWFPVDMKTDQDTDVLIAEMIREKVLLNVYDEVPHSVGVAVDNIDNKKIYATIYVEQDSQKGIIIGRGGEMLKKIGHDSRLDIQKLLSHKVFLDLSVKVKKNWRRDYNMVRKFGYSAE